jgi:dihydrofolate reductase
MDISLIAALDRNHAIGHAGDMPWHLPDDLKRFKALTLGKPVVMGRKTALAIGRALPGRPNIVLSRGGKAPYPGQIVVRSFEGALSVARGEREIAIIGGGQVYALAMPRATRMYLTWIDTAVAHADAYFPLFDARDWREVSRERHRADAQHAHAMDFVEYVRR